MTYHVGFTGTRELYEVSVQQVDKVEEILQWLQEKKSMVNVHHGDCLGVDQIVHNMVKGIFSYMKTTVHPPINPISRAWCQGDEILKEKDYLERNRDIVNSSSLVIGLPKSLTNRTGGTWYTLNYAKTRNKTTLIIDKSGNVIIHNLGV